MTPEIHARAELLFYEALDLPVAARAAFLDDACGVDVDLRREIDELLRAYDTAPGFLQVDTPASPELETEFARLKPEEAGERIGNYKLLEQIGEGGFGVVWVAEQEKPMRRRVALKIIKLGMDTKAVIARFEQERQALAMMDHPNIAKVHEAGMTPFGRPFFVMELVRGIKITEYCDQANLPTHERLQLFITVCQAVQHAHQKGIIHRDLKPSNILVTLHDGVAVPKVIDFGVAKATQQQRLTDLTVYTQFEQMIGTPLYMSPEQAEMSGLDIDTRSDIYSLGVLLYELLVGRTPFDPQELMKAGFDEMRRVIREQEPQKPSTFLSTMAVDLRANSARNRQTESRKWIGQIRGDLDWIVMKALEKDRNRRYETANSLAKDIERHLLSEPVQARPPSTGYRFRRFAQRNKLTFAAGTAVLTALLLGLSVSTWMFFKEKDARKRAVAAEQSQSEERRKAESEASKSRQVAQFLKDMLEGVGPSVALGRDTTLLREILDKTVERVGKDLKDQPEVEAELRESLGSVHLALAEYVKAEAMARESLAIRKKLFGNEHANVATSLGNLAVVLRDQGNFTEAETMNREALAMQRKLFGNEHPQVATALSGLAFVLYKQGKLAEAETMFREARAMQKNDLGNEHADVGSTLNNFAQVLRAQGNFTEAETMNREALAMHRKLFGNEHPRVATALGNLASLLDEQGKLAEAEPMLREALAMRKKLFGNEHPHVANALSMLASLLNEQGKLAEAEPMLREALAMARKLSGNEHPDVASYLNNLAVVLGQQGKLAEAETIQREALALLQKLVGNEHPDVAGSLNNLAVLLLRQGKLAQAETTQREALALHQKLLGNEHPDVATALNNVARVLIDQGKLAEAEAMHREVLAMQRKLLGNEHPNVAGSLTNLATVLFKQRRFTDAETMTLEALAMQRRLWGNEHPDVAISLHTLAVLLSIQGKLAEAEAMHRETLAMRRKLLGNEHPDVGESLHSLAHLIETEGNLAQAESMHREALAIRRKRFSEADAEVTKMRRCLAKLIKSEGKLVEAETMYREELATRRKLLGNEHLDVAISLNELGSVLVLQEKLAEAESTYREALAIIRGSANSDPPKLEVILASLVEFHFRQGHYAESEPYSRELVASRQARLPSDAADVLMPTASLARLLADWAWSDRSSASKLPGSKLRIAERAREAERLLRECLAVRLRAVRPDLWRIADVRSRLGGALVVVAVTDPAPTKEARLAILAEAETLLLEGHEGLLKGKKSDLKYKQDSFTRLVHLYQAWEKPDQAAEWQQKLADFDKADEQKLNDQTASP